MKRRIGLQDRKQFNTKKSSPYPFCLPMNELSSPAGILHDIRNLMTVISLNGNMLSAYVDDGEPSELVEGITQAANQLTHLIQDLQPDRSPSIKRPECTHVNEIIAQVVNFTHITYPSVEFVLDEQEEEHCVALSVNKLFRCLMNIASNAAEAAASNPRCQPRVEFRVREGSENKLAIQVLDTGTGFPFEDPREAFDPNVSRRFSATNGIVHEGLGLHVVRCIVEGSGGLLCVQRLANLTQVCIEIPLAR